MSEHTLDVRGLLCPMPVIRTQDRVKELAPGARLQILCTDPGAVIDIPVWCRINGHRVLQTDEQPKLITFLIEVGEASG
ncbi:MAG TPA: sulfurtransferase TusA family protein [Pseudodesulfovibrio sp.]|nr:sulfurtransferase TusA family protein [Pseudodesulfovibrio sp.]